LLYPNRTGALRNGVKSGMTTFDYGDWFALFSRRRVAPPYIGTDTDVLRRARPGS
jgi:hypothetical protein